MREFFKVMCYSIIVQSVVIGGSLFGETDELAELLMDADEDQFMELFPKGFIYESVIRRIEPVLPSFENELQRKLPPDANAELRKRLSSRQANAAIVLLRMDKPEKAWSFLKQSPNPTARTFLIHRLGPLGVKSKQIIGRLNDEPDVTIWRALIMSLGEFDETSLLDEARRRFLPKLQETYRTTPDAGLHAACEWLLRQWNQEDWLKQLNQELPDEKERGSSQWYVNKQGQLMVVIAGPVSFLMGSPTTEVARKADETQHKERIEHTFAIAAKEVTVEDFLRFKEYHFYHEHHARKSDCPVNNITWYDAVEYCNWLNRREGIPKAEWCYEPNKDGEYKLGMATVENHLKRTGYRLPTEAEWEYSCRAMSETSYSCGESEDLLVKFESIRPWSFTDPKVGLYPNVTYPVGTFKPNDLGMFDMQGNVREWCQDPCAFYGKRIDNNGVLGYEPSRVLRGGSCSDMSWRVRCAVRDYFSPGFRDCFIGFRLARTLPE